MKQIARKSQQYVQPEAALATFCTGTYGKPALATMKNQNKKPKPKKIVIIKKKRSRTGRRQRLVLRVRL